MDKKPMTAREALVDVLKRNGGTMAAKDIVAKALPKAPGLKSSKTAKSTLYGTLREEALKPNGRVVKVEQGQYRARTSEEMKALASEPEAEALVEAPVVEPTREIEVTPDPKPQARRSRRSTARQTTAA